MTPADGSPPSPGQHRDALPIGKRLRVLDLGGTAQAYAGRIFVDLGADTVLVEPPGGCEARRVPPLLEVPGELGPVSPFFVHTGAGKRSVSLDTTRLESTTLLEQLVAGADLVLLPDDVELAGRGIDGAKLRSLNERVVVSSLTPFGSSGPRRHWRGSDLVAWAASGVMPSLGDADRPPLAPRGGFLGQSLGALNAVMGSLLALRVACREGFGQFVDISMQEGVLTASMEVGPLLALEGYVPRTTHPRAASGIFPVQDGHIVLLPVFPAQWDATATWIKEELGIEEATMDVFKGTGADRAEFAEVINAWVTDLTSRHTRRSFFAEAQRRGIPAAPVNRPADILSDPHLEATGAWQQICMGATTLRMPRGPLHLDSAAQAYAVPRPGQHNDEIYGVELGLGDSELQKLRRLHVI
jgi:benzylsuccinate CoA-transferase BbsE subunit